MFIERMKNAISGENGGPMVEMVVAISVALIFVVGLLGLGATVISWVANATGAVRSLQ